MKYKALLAGKNNSVIDDFFVQMNDSFESVTTSTRYEDIIRHLKYFQPDIFVYCIYNESRDTISRMVSLKSRLAMEKIPFILIGLKEECDEFEKIAVAIADMILLKPLNAGAIQEQLLMFINNYDPSTDLKQNLVSNVNQSINYNQSNALLSNQEESVPKSASAQDAPPVRKHILVVDDNPLMLRSIKELLKNKYDIATAVNGKIALKFLENKTTDLILLDYEMPEENGPAVLEKLRANDVTKDIPVIFLTGITEQNKIHEALILKPQGYLLKPVDHEKLLTAISKCIG